MISAFSVITGVFFYSVMLLIACLLMRKTDFLREGGVNTVMALTAVAVLRLFLPFEIPESFALQSWHLMGKTQSFLRAHEIFLYIFGVVWAIGAVIVVGWSIAELYIARKCSRGYIVVEDEAVQAIARSLSIKCPVVVTPSIRTPYVAGFFRHTIYFPALKIPEPMIRMALAHEAQHIRTHDSLIKLLFGLVSAVMWWNPVAHFARALLDVLLEMRCDRCVTRGMDERGRIGYVEMLAMMARLATEDRRTPALALDESPVIGKEKREDVLKRRADVIINGKDKAPLRVRAAAMSLIVVLFCASYLLIWQGAGAPPAETFQNDPRTVYDSTYYDREINEETYNAFIFKEADGRYQLFIDYEFNRYLTEDEVVSDQYKNLHIFEGNRQR